MISRSGFYQILYWRLGLRMHQLLLHLHLYVLWTVQNNEGSTILAGKIATFYRGYYFRLSCPQCFSNYRRCSHRFLVSSTRGAVTSAYSGTNRRTKLSVPINERNSLISVGSGNSLMALIRSSPILVPCSEMTWPKRLTCFEPNCNLGRF